VLWTQTGVELELVESLPLLEWLANNYKSFGATLEIITDKSQEGAQFVRGFGGIGGQNCLHHYYYNHVVFGELLLFVMSFTVVWFSAHIPLGLSTD